MRACEVAKILLVRAIEESGPLATTSPEADAAAGAAADHDGEPAWLLRRADHRLAHEFGGHTILLRLADAPQLPALFFAVPFALGLVSNWLGPSERIHVLYNPIAVLVAWNLLLYAVLAVAPLVVRRRARKAAAAAPAATGPRGARRATARPRGVRGWLLRRTAPAFFFRLRHDAELAAGDAAAAGRVARRFWSLWVDAAGALPAARVRRLFHGGAAALVIGAVAGMLARGVFFQYAMVWRSTWIHDPGSIAAVLRVALGPAAELLGRPLPDAADAARMLGEAGVPAGPWILLWATTAALFVVLPRALLMIAAELRRRVLARRVELPLDDAYFEALLAGVRRAEIERIQGRIDADVRAEMTRLVDDVADFVCARLYDERLVPKVRAFRETGGSVEALEQEMAEACQAFQPELDEELDRARGVLEAGLRAAVIATVGRSLGETGAQDVAIGADDLPVGAFGGAALREISSAVGAAVSAGVGLVVATLSGGFGHHLGAALLVTLLHTTGPVGFLIGGLGGVAVAMAGWYLGRERVASGMRGVRLPRVVARIALRDAALAKLIEQGRSHCGSAVREKLGAELEPLVPRLAEEIWAKLRPALPAAREGTRRGSG